MTQYPVTFMFSSVEAVNDLADLMDYMLPFANFAILEYGSHTEQIEAKQKLQRYGEWIILLRDFARNHNKVEC